MRIKIVPYKQLPKLFEGKTVNSIHKKMCGELIGQGLYRDVYILKQNPAFVVKIERDMTGGNFANAMEWRNYINNKEWKFLADYLAECIAITQTGQVMIQRRVEHRSKKEYPKMIPAMFTDTKYKNFGWTGAGKFVCCDYSFIPFFTIKVGHNSMKKAKWWG